VKILITGKNGYIAKTLNTAFKKIYKITTIGRDDLDLTDPYETLKYFSDKYFDIVIHTAVLGGNRLKTDTWDIMDSNLKMYYNLLNCKSNFNKFIHFGSGAEIYKKDTPYGLSKAIIAKSIKNKPNFYNIRIYAVFDEKEDNRRFIKSNILRYKKKEPLIIHQDKKMDFFYIQDLISLTKYYIEQDSPLKEVDCTYEKTFTLSQITSLINNLDNHKCNIIIETPNIAQQYSGTYIPLISYIGLEKGIKEVYKAI